MQDHRPLREVPPRALHALHSGIEKRDRLMTGILASKYITGIEVCAMGALLSPQAQKAYSEYNPYDGGYDGRGGDCYLPDIWEKLGANMDNWRSVVALNNTFIGSPEERREFMLRHIVEELRARGKSLPVGAAKKELVRNE